MLRFIDHDSFPITSQSTRAWWRRSDSERKASIGKASKRWLQCCRDVELNWYKYIQQEQTDSKCKDISWNHDQYIANMSFVCKHGCILRLAMFDWLYSIFTVKFTFHALHILKNDQSMQVQSSQVPCIECETHTNVRFMHSRCIITLLH